MKQAKEIKIIQLLKIVQELQPYQYKLLKSTYSKYFLTHRLQINPNILYKIIILQKQIQFVEQMLTQPIVEIRNEQLKQMHASLQMSVDYPEYFGEQKQKLIKSIQSLIIQTNNSMKDVNQEFIKWKGQFCCNNQALSIVKLKQFLRKAAYTKSVAQQLYAFNSNPAIRVGIELSQIQNFQDNIDDLKLDLKSKFDSAKDWNIEKSLTHDSLERIELRNQQIKNDMTLLQSVGNIFTDDIPTNATQSIQKQKQTELRLLESRALEQIKKSFTSQQEVETQLVRKLNTLQTLLNKKGEMNIFPSNMKLDPKVNDELKYQFKKNNDELENFINNPKVKQAIQSLIKDFAKRQQTLSRQIKSIQKKWDDQRKKFIIQHETKLATQLATINPSSPTQADQIDKINKQYSSDKTVMLNDFNSKQDTQLKKLIQQLGHLKKDLDQQINEKLKDGFALNLIINKRTRSKFGCQPYIKEFKKTVDDHLRNLEKRYSKKVSKTLFNCLKQYESPFSHQLVSEAKIFTCFNKQKFIQQTKGSTFQMLLKKIPQINDSPQRQKVLLIRIEQFRIIYKGILEEYVRTSHKTNIINETKRMGQMLSTQYQKKGNAQIQRYKLLAYIFAIWTILRADTDENGDISFIYKPHDGQILAIFLLLQFDVSKNSNTIAKAMVQVSTGQGKSVILAALACYLALVGYEVYEACYSMYLSSRDYKDFEELFECLGIKDKIRYNIFPEICKMMLDQSPTKPFTGKVKQLITNQSIWNKVSSYVSSILPKNQKNNILLIDEADVFLDQNYIGQNYLPSVVVRTPGIKALLDFVWSNRSNLRTTPNPDLIIKSSQFEKVCTQISNPIFKEIMRNQTHAMVRGVSSYQQDTYTVMNGKIYYKEGDGLSDKIHYGYRTIFAYYHQYHINKKITDVNELEKQAMVNLAAAAFSYAKLPGYFKSILGVTGTLQSMSDGQKKILKQKFQVKKLYVQPSIYPASNRIVKFQRCYHNKLFQEVVKDIDRQHAKKRPIIIFFKTKHNAYDFFESKQFLKYRSDSSVITYQVNPQDRDYRIQISAQENKITLLTCEFSRGTDFKLNVKDPKTHPGIHVISTFLPSSFSDYVQLVGRTGRQGKNGSAMIFILQDQEVPANKVAVSNEQAQKFIKQKDNTQWKTRYQQIDQKMKITNQQHDQFVKLYTQCSSIDTIFGKIKQLNYQNQIKFVKSRTAIVLDGTGSMGGVFDKIKAVIRNAIPEIYQTIKNTGQSGQFELKFVIYRNYNSTYDINLQYSSFQNKCDNLLNWIAGTYVQGGWATQAIEIGLQHLNTLDGLNQFIIIGDIASNTTQQTIQRRQNFGQAYWLKNGFPLTNYDAQLNKLASKGIKGHSYYLHAHNKAFFDNLSQRTGGQSRQLRINQPEITTEFVKVVSELIIKNLGQLIGGDAQSIMLNQLNRITSGKRYV